MPPQIGFRHLVRKRAKGKCEGCGRRITNRINADSQGSIHHRFPRRNGLDNSPQNLLFLCLKCHRDVHLDEDLAALRGHILHGAPWEVPALIHRHRWVWLTPGGGYVDLPQSEARRRVDRAEATRGNRHVGVA